MLNIGEGNGVETVDATTELLKLKLPALKPTAIFCCNDLMAVGAMNACKRLGLSVPEEISIMGYDNIALSRLVEPKITTMDQNMFQLGESAAQLLIETIRGGKSKRIMLDNVLVSRDTTGVCKDSL